MTDLDVLREELFCTKFELDTLAGIALNGKAERWVPMFTGLNKDEDHLCRYDVATNYVRDLCVLDIACGVGKGSQLLADKGHAKSVMGGDISADSIRYAKHRYGGPKISFREMDGTNFHFNQEFDVVISFETIEHIQL